MKLLKTIRRENCLLATRPLKYGRYRGQSFEGMPDSYAIHLDPSFYKILKFYLFYSVAHKVFDFVLFVVIDTVNSLACKEKGDLL
jgi:hypothetical protein